MRACSTRRSCGGGARAACGHDDGPRGSTGGVERRRPLSRRRGPGVAEVEIEARWGVGTETETRRGGGAEAEWRPAAAAAAKSIWAEARIEGEGERPGLCYIYRGATLVPAKALPGTKLAPAQISTGRSHGPVLNGHI